MTFQSDAITKLIIYGGKFVIAITNLFQETNFLNLVIFTTVEYFRKTFRWATLLNPGPVQKPSSLA